MCLCLRLRVNGPHWPGYRSAMTGLTPPGLGAQVVVSEGSNVMLYALKTGQLQHIFHGDEEGRHLGEPEGHLGTITALYFYKFQAYSGSIDTTIQVWDTRKLEVGGG
jgi:hypothetical protein